MKFLQADLAAATEQLQAAGHRNGALQGVHGDLVAAAGQLRAMEETNAVLQVQLQASREEAASAQVRAVPLYTHFLAATLAAVSDLEPNLQCQRSFLMCACALM